MQTYVGMDLHSNNTYIGIIDSDGKRIFDRRLANDSKAILAVLRHFGRDIQVIVVESTFNWYWLVDMLMDAGYDVRLANPAAIQAYSGIKHADDRHDAYWLAEMMRLGILPEGYIYPKEGRPVRDILRRRMLFVQQRTTQLLSLQSMLQREGLATIRSSEARRIPPESLNEYLPDERLRLVGKMNIEIIQFLDERAKRLEDAVLSEVKLEGSYQQLLTVPGIGQILAMIIMLETGDISRFPSVGNYTSYCRNAKAERTSNQKRKGSNNAKNGNKYLSWAYVEAAHSCVRWCAPARSFYQRKKAKTKTVVAVKALAAKLSKACYFIIRDDVPFKQERIFGAVAVNQLRG